jgi:AraC-like DNA-binding protein
MIELCLSRAEKRTLSIKGYGDIELLDRNFSCLVGDAEVSSYADDGVTVEISSIAVAFDHLEFEAKEFETADFEDPNLLLLPHIAEGASEGEFCEYERLLHRFTHCYMEKSVASELECSAITFEILAKLDSVARRSNKTKKDKYINYYVMKADSILHHRFKEKITQIGVAAELGITPAYLSAIYKSSMGIGFSDRLFEIRMKEAERLVNETSLTVPEIALAVGFDDESHLRRRFKQYFGTSIREYRCISNEQTLYHKKPEREYSGK